MAYAWIITKDHLAEDDESGDVGIIGPSTAPESLIAQLKDGKGRAFRLYDDDGELYYTGRILTSQELAVTEYKRVGEHSLTIPIAEVTGPDTASEEQLFGPLWDFGEGWAGCTDIRYRCQDTGRWGTL